MRSKKVLAFGEVMMRLMVPDYKKLSQSRNLEYIFTGTGVNILGALEKLGHKGSLLTKLPENALGESAKLYISGLGIDTSHISMGDNYLGIYFLEKGYGVRGSRVTYGDRLNSSFCKSQISDYDIDKALEGVGLIHFCGISLAVTKNVRETALNLMYRAKEKRIKIAFDCNYRVTLWDSYDEARELYKEVLAHTDIVFAGQLDATNLLGYTSYFTQTEERLSDLFKQIIKDFNIECICGTLRESNDISRQKLKGYVITKDNSFFSKYYEFDIYDRIGTGDAFAAGIIHSLLEGYSFNETVEFSICSAVLAHTTYGDTPVCTLDEIICLKNGNMKELIR